jgi:hypothetical protein
MSSWQNHFHELNIPNRIKFDGKWATVALNGLRRYLSSSLLNRNTYNQNFRKMNNLSRRPSAIAAIAGVGILTGYMYSRPSGEKSQPVQASTQAKTKQAKIKRDLGMSGAGIGGNVSAGSTELEDPSRPGRSISESTSDGKSSQPSQQQTGSDNINPPTNTEQSTLGSTLFAKSSGDRSSLEGHHDTRIASNLTETPTKRS